MARIPVRKSDAAPSTSSAAGTLTGSDASAHTDQATDIDAAATEAVLGGPVTQSGEDDAPRGSGSAGPDDADAHQEDAAPQQVAAADKPVSELTEEECRAEIQRLANPGEEAREIAKQIANSLAAMNSYIRAVHNENALLMSKKQKAEAAADAMHTRRHAIERHLKQIEAERLQAQQEP